MNLRKLVLSGFKSFADRTELGLETGITGIVGPNGCGKSNIVDALRWLMGESRASQLRQESNAEIIFNGSESRRASDWCSVEMHLLNDGSKDLGMWQDYSELSFRRQIERDGESSYFINGQRVRRRDVVDLFAGTGAGARSYGVVAQDQITQIVQSEPKRIRVLLEEAAGVATYKDRRRATENRLQGTQGNLARLADIIAEVEAQMKVLAKQASMTVKVSQYKRQLEDARSLALLYELEKLQAQGAASGKRLAELTKLQTSAKSAVDSQEKVIAKARDSRQKLAARQSEGQSAHYAASARLEKARQSIREIELMAEQDQRQLDDLQLRQQQRSATIDQLRQEADDIDAQLVQLQEQIQKGSDGSLAAGARLKEIERQAQLAKDVLDKAQSQAQSAAEALQQQRAAKELAEHRASDLQKTKAAADNELAALEQPGKPDEESLAQARGKAKQVREQAIDTETRVQSAGDELASARDDYYHEVSRGGALQAEQEVLQGIAGEDAKRYGDWLQQLGVADAKRVAAAAGISAPGCEKAVDAALAAYLDGYVVPSGESGSWSELPEGLVLVDPDAASAAAVAYQPRSDMPRLLDSVTAQGVWRQVLDRWLAGVYLAVDLEQARSWQSRLQTGETIVTRDGMVVQSGIVRATRSLKTGVAWNARLQSNEQQLAEHAARLAGLKKSFDACAQAHEGLVAQGRQMAAKREQADKELSEVQAQATREQHALEFWQQQQRRLRGVIDNAAGQIKTHLDEVGKLGAREQQAAAQLQSLQQEVASRRDAHEREQGQVEQCREEIRQLEIKQRETQLTFGHQQQRRLEIKERLDAAAVEQQDGVQLIEDCKRHLGERKTDALDKEKDAAEKAMAQATAELREMDERMRNAETAEQNAELQLAQLRARHEQQAQSQHQLELDLAGRKAQIEAVDRQLAERGAKPDDLAELRKAYPDADSLLARVERLEQRITRAGPVNYAAESEYAGCETRMSDYTQQRGDLEAALASLRAAISRIDEEMLGRLRDVYGSLNSKFDEIFKRLFSGGNASIELVGDSLLDAGLELRATPPGKRVATIQALSGGEKTLTALAFLFALNELNPPPFCVLDEVDAALDETNTARFCRLLDSMRDRTQFLIITHNRSVFESVDRLVGVTQEDKGISKIVAVRLDEAIAQAAAGG